MSRSSSSRYVGHVAIAALFSLTSVAWGASTRKLVDSLPLFTNVDAEFQIGPDGTWVVYRADQDQDEVYELYCVDFTLGNTRKLSAPLGNGGDVGSWQLSADGQRAVYWANANGNDMREVFSAAIAGGDGVKLNAPLVGPGSIGGGLASDRAVFIASERESLFLDPYFELFSAPAAGGSVELLSGPLVNGGDVKAVVTRADSGRVLYLADQETDETVELYSVLSDGGNWTKLNSQLVANGDVLADGLALSSDGSRVIYAADQEKDSRIELFSAPAGGGSTTKLNGPLVNGGNVTAGSQRFSANGTRVLYHADQDADEVFEIFSAASTGESRVKLNGPLVLNGDVRSAGVQFSPDGGQVLYTADQNADEVFELFRTPSTGGIATRLNGPLVDGGDVLEDAIFSPDGSRVLYRADQLTDEVIELFSVPSVGGLSTRLNKSLVAGGNVLSAKFSPDGSQVAYLADQDADEVFELYLVPSVGGMSEKISGDLVAGGDVTDWQFSRDGRSLVYRADQNVDEQFELYVVLFDDDLPGDFNRDGVVDAADYTVWRDGLAKGDFSPSQYGLWKSNFGRRLGQGAGAAHSSPAPIPEPTAIVLLFVAAILEISTAGGRSRRDR